MNEVRLTPPEHDPYMLWRRQDSLSRFVPDGIAGVIDIDSYEYCVRCYRPLAVVETKKNTGNDIWTATRSLAVRLGVPGYLLRYIPDGVYAIPGNIPGPKIPADMQGCEVTNAKGETREFTPQQWADHLVLLHKCGCS